MIISKPIFLNIKKLLLDELDLTVSLNNSSIKEKKQSDYFSTLDISLNEHACLLVSPKDFDGSNEKRILIKFFQIEKTSNSVVIFVLNKISTSFRRKLVKNKISFITLSGEIFLPFLGAHLQPQKNVISDVQFKQKKQPLSQNATNLLVLMIYMNSKVGKMFEDDIFNEDGFITNEGEKLLKVVRKFTNIKNKVALSRAMTELEKVGAILSDNKLTHKSYILEKQSISLFYEYKDMMKSPVKDYDEISKRMFDKMSENKLFGREFYLTGDSTLSLISNMNEPDKKSYAIDNSIYVESLIADEALDTQLHMISIEDELISIEQWYFKPNEINSHLFKNDLVFSNIPDPINLYLANTSKNDDRVLSVLEEYVENTLEGDVKRIEI